MAWYNEKGKENDVVVSSRVRFARNIADYPFDSKIDETSAREIIEKVTAALGEGFEKIEFDGLSAAEAGALVEKHYVSPDFAKKKTPHALLKRDDESVSVMICEEDHVRLQCILPGLALDEAYNTADKYDSKLDDELNIAFDGELGYLTHCPTNLGLGMRASVMLFLPALSMTKSMDTIALRLSKLGLIVRGMYGEGSQPEGYLYQISNRTTMGVSEADTIKRLNDIVKQLCKNERRAREVLKSDSYTALADKVWRSYGVLKYARAMSSKEFMSLYADVRLGVALGMIDGVEYERLGEIMIGVLPANLILNNGGKTMSDFERDVHRADYVRGAMA